jgi:predicted aspartyl protease
VRVASNILALVLLALSTTPMASAVAKHTIPFEISEAGFLVVKMELNDEVEVDAVLDTGATIALLDHTAAKAAGIEEPDGVSVVAINGLSGVQEFPLVHIDKLDIGGIQSETVRAAYNKKFPMDYVSNILPANNLPHRVLDFDFEEGRLSVYNRRPLAVWRSKTVRKPVERIQGLPFIRIELDGMEALALIDTGASLTVVNSVLADKVTGRRGRIETLELVGATGAVMDLRVLHSRNLAVGEFKTDKFRSIIADPDVLVALGVSEEPVIIVGLDYLSQFRLQIDREAEMMHFSMAAPRREAGITIIAR